MENLTKAYLDIDGVLLTAKRPVQSSNCFELLSFLTQNYDCHWLTTHCKGNAQTAVNYLKGYLDEKTFALIQDIQPTDWETLKTEAIDFDSAFIWLDDYPFEAERIKLREKNCESNLIEVNLHRKNELLEIIRKLEEDLNLSNNTL